MKQLKVTDLKKHLMSKNQLELIKEILNLCKLFPEVKEYYTTKLMPDAEEQILLKYKKIIKNEFFSDRGFGKLRFSIINKAMRNFKKISNNPGHIAELLVACVEYGVEFTNTYGNIDERFYVRMAALYEDAAAYVIEKNLEETFQKRLGNLVDASNGIGSGFYEELVELYYTYFDDEAVGGAR
ncbi:DUF6155 family protein [Sporomusa termitida]|uniref:Uncharacterized protein n=1 Tax=Sporomusa termitida TaxID=2377 RepID=A0A517DPA5_9FIRM|nr:DUF6155 family protein [Sporomusa termitida]QDR79193.1 hypothetical protein SPTER_04610 [Sporomusa termitida]